MNISKNSLSIALLLSVAINLLVLGAVGGITMAGLRHDAPTVRTMTPGSAVNYQFNPRAFLRALPENERRRAMRAMRSATGKHRQLSFAIMRTRAELGELLAAEQLDTNEIESRFKHLNQLEAETQKLGQSIVIKILADLDPQTRRRVIKAAGRRPNQIQGRRPNRPGQRQAPGN